MSSWLSCFCREAELCYLCTLRILSPTAVPLLQDPCTPPQQLAQLVLELLAPMESLQRMYSQQQQAARRKEESGSRLHGQETIATEQPSPAFTGADRLGLLAQITKACLHHVVDQKAHPVPRSHALLSAFEYVESPLRHLARAGLGLLTEGLGR
jgi:hypothetical protein